LDIKDPIVVKALSEKPVKDPLICRSDEERFPHLNIVFPLPFFI
jgi:hypothetical protein